MANGFMWFDLAVEDKDAEGVTNFYSAVFDGPLAPDDSESNYRAWLMNGEQPWAAIVRGDNGTSGRWVPYVQVDDLDAATESAVAAGGKVISPKTDGPAGTAVTLADPAGAPIALWVPFEETAQD